MLELCAELLERWKRAQYSGFATPVVPNWIVTVNYLPLRAKVSQVRTNFAANKTGKA